jgi:PAS domain S-box-containing protein
VSSSSADDTRAAFALLSDAARRLAAVPNPLPLLRALFAFAPVGFQVYKADGHCLMTNKAFRDLFGSEPPPEYNVLQDEIAQRNGVLELIQRAFRGETVTLPPIWYDPRELKQVEVKEGRRVAMAATFFPLVDEQGTVTHVAIAFKDLTAEWEEHDRLKDALARNQALAAELHATEERLRRTLEAADVGTWEWDIPRNRVQWSSNIERIFGLAPGTFGGTYEAWLDLVHPEDRERVTRMVASALERAGPYDTELRVLRPDGSVGWQSTRGYVVVDEQGRPKALRGVVFDITQRRLAEAALHARAQFDQQAIGIVSHDLRNPINAIHMSASLLLRRGGLDEQQAKALARILSSSERAQRMIRDFLDFSQAQLGGGIPVQPREADLHEVAQSVVDEVHLAHPDRRVEVVRSGRGEGLWDPDRLAQVVGNLVANAFQHGAPGEVVRVATRGDDDGVEIEVVNRGPPIPPELQRNLFAPFQRGRDAKGRGTGSIGLGLYITRQLVLAHGGSVEVRSSLESGTVFTVRLPRQSAPR